MYEFPPSSLYNTICTPEAYKKRPGSPIWHYDGQFIWLQPKPVKYGFGPGMKPYPPGSVGAEIEKKFRQS